MEATAVKLDEPVRNTLDALIEKGRASECVDLSLLDKVVQANDLDDAEAQAAHDYVEASGLPLRDDCGQEAEQAGYKNRAVAEQTTDAMQLFFNEVGKYPLLSKEEEIELAKAIERGDLDAKEKLINSNLRLVVSNARRYLRQDLNLLDLVQEGIFGLIRATEKFDWRKGFKFSTYATFWIRQSIQRALETKERTIRIPGQVAQRERKVMRTERELATRLGRDPTTEEVAKEAELTTEQVDEVRELARVVTSLDRSVGEEDSASLGELIPDEREGPQEELALSLRDETLRRAVEALPEDERRVIERRYGVDGDDASGLRETSRRLDLRLPEVKELESRGLERLAQLREVEAIRDAA